ncbi:hypothetical protein SUGI_0298840 [Cryptomeria japonica]|nr:hypothetical protein SUGI_0298840 [Cryptomeria japonica]
MAGFQKIYHALLFIFLLSYYMKYATPLLTDDKGFTEKQNNGPVEFNGNSLKQESIMYRRFLDTAANDYDIGEPNPKHDPKKGRGGRRP